jgi:hypothetical protein
MKKVGSKQVSVFSFRNDAGVLDCAAFPSAVGATEVSPARERWVPFGGFDRA